nr:hypothetical protein Iba_chr11bCG8290 [Ipomoea batatas]
MIGNIPRTYDPTTDDGSHSSPVSHRLCASRSPPSATLRSGGHSLAPQTVRHSDLTSSLHRLSGSTDLTSASDPSAALPHCKVNFYLLYIKIKRDFIHYIAAIALIVN